MYHSYLVIDLVCVSSSIFSICFFFKQKTAYEMRISDWSSDVCSSDLLEADVHFPVGRLGTVRRGDEIAVDAVPDLGHLGTGGRRRQRLRLLSPGVAGRDEAALRDHLGAPGCHGERQEGDQVGPVPQIGRAPV